MNSKELLDLGVITQAEYEELVKKLKPFLVYFLNPVTYL